MRIMKHMSPEGAAGAAMESRAASGTAGGVSLRNRLAMMRLTAEDRRSAQRFKIRRFLRAHGPATEYMITKETGINARTAQVRLQELRSVGDVTCERKSLPDDPGRFLNLWRLDR